MFSISKDFAPPLKMIQPFFMIGSIFYFFAMLFTLFINPQDDFHSFAITGWVHWYMLGFVMMIIFGSMAQLVPVVVEVGHVSVDVYYIIYPLLAIGTIAMAIGFWFSPAVLPFGGLMVLTSMMIFLLETFFTLKKVTRISVTVKAIIASNVFLTIAIIIGFLMSLTIGAGVSVDIPRWLGAHVVLVLGGYVVMSILGMSMILLPMFGLSHGFDEKPVNRAFNLMVAGVVSYLLSSVVNWNFLGYLALVLMYVAVGFYVYQVYLIYKDRARKENDVYAKSMYAGYASLAISAILGIVSSFSSDENIAKSAVWFLIVGFVGFLVNGHLFKIVPFLVWFERFSPLVGKKKVPMLKDMVPEKIADYQFYFSFAGIVIAGIGLLVGSESLFKGGASLLIVGAGFMLNGMITMLNFGKELKS